MRHKVDHRHKPGCPKIGYNEIQKVFDRNCWACDSHFHDGLAGYARDCDRYRKPPGPEDYWYEAWDRLYMENDDEDGSEDEETDEEEDEELVDSGSESVTAGDESDSSGDDETMGME